MRTSRRLQNVLIGAAAVLVAGTQLLPDHEQQGPVMAAATAIISGEPLTVASTAPAAAPTAEAATAVDAQTNDAVASLVSKVRKLSSDQALTDAFHSYFAYKSEHPDAVKKPLLYFVDYGLSSTEKRGYVFNMDDLSIVDGPFTVAHGRASSSSQYGVPTKFSNAFGSDATSLGLYVTKALYTFHGHTGGHPYTSVGIRLDGVSTGFNDNAYARKVVAHGAPYVTPTKAGRSEGCPAMEPSRAKRLLPELANGAMVFLFAPNSTWLAGDPWISANGATLAQAS
jgi:hypothetical protein